MTNLVQGFLIVLTGVVNLLTSILNINIEKQYGESIVLPVILAIGSIVLIGAGIFVMCLPEGL